MVSPEKKKNLGTLKCLDDPPTLVNYNARLYNIVGSRYQLLSGWINFRK